MIFNVSDGGGGGLNYKVVGGTTQPASPRENEIWVNTDQTITDVVFSATAPSPSAGLVWIQTGKSSPVAFNAAKRGTLMAYPDRCFQYVSGLWVAKTAKSYLSGAWVDWRTWLFREGEGPVADWRVTANGSVEVAGAVTNNQITIDSEYNAGGQRGMEKRTPIDLTDLNYIKVELIANTNNWNLGVALTEIIFNTSFVRGFTVPQSPNVRQTVSLDVSDLTGSYYFGGNNGADATTHAYIYNIWGE